MMSELVLASFIRLVTNPRIFQVPTTLELALQAVERIRQHPRCICINPGPRHFELFLKLCRDSDAKGNLSTDAYHSALAIEHGCRWYTFDRDFARFRGLDWATPDLG